MDQPRGREPELPDEPDEHSIANAKISRYRLASQYVRPGDRVVDLRCGTGAGLQTLRNESAGGHFLGFDACPEAIAEASGQLAAGVRNLEYRVADSRSALATLPECSVDLVLAMDWADFLATADLLLPEIRRVLIPGGRLVLSAPITRQQLQSFLSSHLLLDELHDDEPIASAIRDPLDGGEKIPYVETVFANLNSVAHPSTQYARWYRNPWIVHSMVHVGYRVKSPALLGDLALRLLAQSPAESADYGAALCILAYQQLGASGVLHAAAQVSDRIAAYVNISSDNPHVLRWRISLTFVQAQLHLKAGDLVRARNEYRSCAAIDPFVFSPHLATKTADAFFWGGWVSLKLGDAADAERTWKNGIVFGDRLINRPIADVLMNPSDPNLFDHGDGMREFVLAMESVTKCANGLHLLARENEGRSVNWALVQKTFKDRGDQLDNDLLEVRAVVARLKGELDAVRGDLDASRNELVVRTAELETTRRELINLDRQLGQELIERTGELDTARRDLLARTGELDAERGELRVRTANLVARTRELDGERAELVARTSQLDATRKELIDRTIELDATRQELIDRTREVDAARKDLAHRTAELAAARQRRWPWPWAG